jgi:hypothetical protein
MVDQHGSGTVEAMLRYGQGIANVWLSIVKV